MRSPRVPWWPGSIVSEGGVHVHHLVFGIVTMMVSGVIGYALEDVGFWYEASAVGFGIGIGLTIDEFALWVHLEDVYWEKEGRSSIDATLIAVGIMGLDPHHRDAGRRGHRQPGQLPADLRLAGPACLLRADLLRQGPPDARRDRVGRPVHRPLRRGADRQARVAVGAALLRRAQPARSRPRPSSASTPDRRTERFKERLRDAVGGSTSEEYQAKLASARAGRAT